MQGIEPLFMTEKNVRSGRVSKFYYGDRNYKPNEWNVIADLEGPGSINHIWVTFADDALLGRRVLLRCFWDDETEPSVEAPIGDFFGVPFGLFGTQFGKMSTPWLVMAPENGLNCYFTMPFARRARIEIMPAEEVSLVGFYIQVDYCQFEKELPREWADFRFHAQYRFENPCEQYGRNYLFLDATGRGMLAGVTFGIDLQYPQPDPWYHGGGDTMLIDGESRPAVLHGIGAEDFISHSHGVREFHSNYVGTPHEEKDADGRLKRVGLYRFFIQDPVFFSSSIRATLGALGNAYSSVVYWYQTEPHRPFFRTPSAEARMPGAEASYGRYDLESQPAEEWKLLAPFPCNQNEPFETVRPFEQLETGAESYRFHPSGYAGICRASLPGGDNIDVRWKPQIAYHHFIDFNVVARPAIGCICLETEVVGYALRYVDSESDREAVFNFAFDDRAAVWVNEKPCFSGSHPHGLRSVQFTARLHKGRNRILVKLSNHDNDNWRFWGFCLRME
jgi:hypothetical protein